MLDRADCADFGCHNSIRLETKHFLNTLALTFISFSGRFVFAMQKHYIFFCERSSSLFKICRRVDACELSCIIFCVLVLVVMDLNFSLHFYIWRPTDSELKTSLYMINIFLLIL